MNLLLRKKKMRRYQVAWAARCSLRNGTPRSGLQLQGSLDSSLRASPPLEVPKGGWLARSETPHSWPEVR